MTMFGTSEAPPPSLILVYPWLGSIEPYALALLRARNQLYAACHTPIYKDLYV